jgi:hypothetical protein
MARRAEERRLAGECKSLPADVAGQHKLIDDLLAYSADVREEMLGLYRAHGPP